MLCRNARRASLVHQFQRRCTQYFDVDAKEDDDKRTPHGLVLSEFTTKKDFPIEGFDASTLSEVQTVHSSQSYKKLQKSEAFTLTRKDYITQLQKFVKGRVNVVEYKGKKLTLVGVAYDFLPVENAYKILLHSKPDFVFLQMQPDLYKEQFEVNVTNPKTNFFSNRNYFKQLVQTPQELLKKSLALRRKLREIPKKNAFFVNYLAENEGIIKKEHDISIRTLPSSRVDTSILAAACVWNSKNPAAKLVCADLPHLITRANLLHGLTLAQLQSMFEQSCKGMASTPDCQPHLPISMAHYLYPELLLLPSDRYMSTLIEYAIHKGHDNIVAFVGEPQNETILELLDKRTVSNLEADLKPCKPHATPLRDMTLPEITEKLALMDVMEYGIDIEDKLDGVAFGSTYALIKKYAMNVAWDTNSVRKIRLLHLDMLKKYAQYGANFVREGEKMKKRGFLKQVMML